MELEIDYIIKVRKQAKLVWADKSNLQVYPYELTDLAN